MRQFSSYDLKLLAMGTMAADHAAVALWGHRAGALLPYEEIIYTAMRSVGRMAFPLFAFLVVQGVLYTKDVKKYGLRLFILAVASEIPYDLLSVGRLVDLSRQNTAWGLLIAMAAMAGVSASITPKPNGGPVSFWAVGKAAAIILMGAAVTVFTRTDYGLEGYVFILVLYFFNYDPVRRMAAGGLTALWVNPGIGGMISWIAFFFMNRYNGERGKRLGLAAYGFYPVHMLILYLAGAGINGINF